MEYAHHSPMQPRGIILSSCSSSPRSLVVGNGLNRICSRLRPRARARNTQPRKTDKIPVESMSAEDEGQNISCGCG